MQPRARPRPPKAPSLRNPSSLRNSPAPAAARRSIRGCPNCNKTDSIREEGGQLVCFNCATVVSDSVIVNDVTFGEAPSGAALVQGTTVHEGQRYAKSAGTSFRHGGRAPEDIAEAGNRYAKEEMSRLANSLLISNLVDRAFRLYTMARVHHFHRPVQESVAICLYIVCRQLKGNTTLLIDFAEKIRQNVFDLGSVYKKFVRAIGLEEDLEDIAILEIEPLLYKFAKRLEFGHATRQVANDAALILSRMDRDWMVTGRQPPALCGASLILAARMNNFRRSVREVVYVVKCGDAAVMKRLWEFRQTKAGQMTVQDFRLKGHLLIDKDAKPPSLWIKETQPEQAVEPPVDPALENNMTNETQQISSLSTPNAPRRDADGFAIPNPPTPRPRGRPRKRLVSDNDEDTDIVAEMGEAEGLDSLPKPKRHKKLLDPVLPLLLTKEDLASEDMLEEQIRHEIEKYNYSEDQYTVAVAQARHKLANEASRHVLQSTVPDSEIIDEDEFADDPEVTNCLLTPEEAAVKEKIWVTHNYNWLRLKQERELDRDMELVIGKKKRKSNRKNSRNNSFVHDSPASTPAEASQRMLEKKIARPAFSRHINYEKLKRIYGLPDEASSSKNSSAVGSRESSVLVDNVTKTVTPANDDLADEELEKVEESGHAGTGANPYELGDEEDEDEEEEDEIDYDELGLEGNEYGDEDEVEYDD